MQPPSARVGAPLTPPVHAVLFDMDGLMLDTEPLAARAWSVAAQALGVEFDAALTLRLVGRTFADCEHLIRAHHGDTYPVADLMRGWSGAYDAIVAAEGIALKPGLLEVLDCLEAHAIPKAVATSTRRVRAITKLQALGLIERFAALVGGDEVARGKPAPDIFLEAAARLAVQPAACVVLEDSQPGIEAALGGGMQAIMVPDLHPPATAERRLPVLVVASLHEAKVHLDALFTAAPVRPVGRAAVR